MCDSRSRLTRGDFGDHAQRPWSHRVVPALRQRPRASMNQGDASSGRPKYAFFRPLDYPTNNKRLRAKVRGRRGCYSRTSNCSWDSTYLSDSDSTTGQKSSSDAEGEDEMYHAVDNHGSNFTSTILGPDRLSYAQSYRHDPKSRASRKVIKRTSPTSVVSDPVSTKRDASRNMHDSATRVKASDRNAESRFEPPRAGQYGLDSSLRAGTRPLTISGRRYNLSEDEAEWRKRGRILDTHNRHELYTAGSVLISSAEYLSLHRLSKVTKSTFSPQASPSNGTIDPAEEIPSDHRPYKAPIRHDSAMSGERYISVQSPPQIRSKMNSNIETVPSSVYEDSSARTVKRYATEMSRDVMDRETSQKSPRYNVHAHRRVSSQDESGLAKCGPGPQMHTGRDVETNSAAQHDSLLRMPDFENIRPSSTSGRVDSITRPTSSEYNSPLQSGDELQQVRSGLLPNNPTGLFVGKDRPSPSNCQAWLSEQPQESQEMNQDSPNDPPSTLYQPESLEVSELDSQTSTELEMTCHGIVSMRTYLAASGSQHAFGPATWKDAEDMLEELTHFDLTASSRGIHLRQFIELIPSAAKEAHQYIDATAVNAWLFSCQIDATEEMRNDTLLEVLHLVCIEICDLGITVFRLACFVADLIRSLADMSDWHNSQNVDAIHEHTTPSSGSSANDSSQRVCAGPGDPSASSSNTFEMEGTGNAGLGQNNGKRKFSGGQDQDDEDFEAEEPGPEGHDADDAGGKPSAAIPCVADQCKTSHSFISIIIRCLKKYNIIVCSKCWGEFPNEKSFKDHFDPQLPQALQQSKTGKHGGQSACQAYCVSSCLTTAHTDNSHSAEAIKNQRHKINDYCPRPRSAELRSAQWRYLYAVTHPDCSKVPNLVVRRKKSTRKPPMEQVLASAVKVDLHPPFNSTAAFVAMQVANEGLQAERKHLFDLLQMSLPHLFENNTAASMILHKCISDKLSTQAGTFPVTSSKSISNDNAVPLLHNAPLTPKSNARNDMRPSVKATAANPMTIDTFQNIAPSTPANRTMTPHFSAPDSQPFQQMQAQAAVYQHQMPAASQSIQYAMQAPQPQPVDNWQPRYVHPTSCDTPQFNNTNEQLTAYDFNAQQRMSVEYPSSEDPFLFSVFGGEFHGDQQRFQ